MINSPSKIDKTPRGIISAISKLSPSFAVRADDIHIILDPNDFYEQLKVRDSVRESPTIDPRRQPPFGHRFSGPYVYRPELFRYFDRKCTEK